jgi:uncharacterized 2Fe-2S/4Fe-4S cluster protein (DUF4445 family)
MAGKQIVFDQSEPLTVPAGTRLTEAAGQAGIFINQPCGGQGRCGRCAVQVTSGQVRRRSTLRLSAKDVEQGYALACQTLVLEDAHIHIPAQETLERRLTSDLSAATIAVPAGYTYEQQSLRRIPLSLLPPHMDDQRDDWSRLALAIRQEIDLSQVSVSLPLLRKIGTVLREGNWQVTAYVALDETAAGEHDRPGILIDLQPGHVPDTEPLWGVCVDVGTTTVTVWLVDLLSGQVEAQAAEYNRQLRLGEDVISRIIFATKHDGQEELRTLVLQSINTLIDRACTKANLQHREPVNGGQTKPEYCHPQQIMKATIAGNSTMIHLLLGIPAGSIRLSPFVTAVNKLPVLTAAEIGLAIYPAAQIQCLPGVASYVGADITAGVHASGLDKTDLVTLFLDIGTNGEIVLGNQDWLVTCACSAGPAFEGAGVHDGMRATHGAIEEVWIDNHTYEPSLGVIGHAQPKGLCGSGLISLLAEMFLTGVIDKGGHFNTTLPTKRIRRRDNSWEYVVAWAAETQTGRDIAITYVDIDNLIRAKAAIYAGFTVLADSIGVPLETVAQVLIGGSFGKYINVEKAVQIGMLPDMPWEQFHFLGNTSVLGAYQAILNGNSQRQINAIADRMTYIELSADNSFYEAFTSALFLPHTDLQRFPSVAKVLADLSAQEVTQNGS